MTIRIEPHSFHVLLRHPQIGEAEEADETVDRWLFHHVATIRVSGPGGIIAPLDEAYALTQNDRIESGTWASRPGVILTQEGERLRCRDGGGLRNLSVGDVLMHVQTAEAWMVAEDGFKLLADTGTCYTVCE